MVIGNYSDCNEPRPHQDNIGYRSIKGDGVYHFSKLSDYFTALKIAFDAIATCQNINIIQPQFWLAETNEATKDPVQSN